MSSTAKKQNLLLKRQSSMSSFNGSIGAFAQSRHKSQQQIQALLHRFNQVNGQVDIEIDKTNFNLINYEHEDEKIKYDPQMMTAKLRKLQNRAEINRAQREFENREKSKLKRFSLHKNKKQTGKTYKAIYQQFLKDNKISVDFDQVSEDESNQNKTKPKNINFFGQLKRHPLLLQYTLQKINTKQKMDEQRVKKMENTLTRLKKQNNQISGEYKELLDDFNKKLQSLNETNPENIIETRFSKFYTKKSSDKLSNEVRNIPRCSRMIEKQNQIVSEIQENSLSKQNKLKLKSKLNQIINNISKSEKLSSFTLPKIQTTTHNRQHERKQL